MSANGDIEQKPRPVRVFCSYSHDDTEYLEQLSLHLKGLEGSGWIESWDDRDIEPGAHWEQELEVNLDDADIIVFLVSASLVASVHCDAEFNAAKRRQDDGEALIIPFLVRWVDYPGTHFAKLEAIPLKDKRHHPVKDWDDRDKAYASLSEKIRRIATKLGDSPRSKRVGPPSTAASTACVAPKFVGVLPSADHFVGREGHIASLEEAMPVGGGGSVVALVGQAGHGKTAIAAEFVHRNRAQYDLVAWLRAEPAEHLARDHDELAGRLGLSAVGGEAGREGVRNWLAEHDRWLLVVDNAESPTLLEGYLPADPRGHVLVTSRNAAWSGYDLQVFVDELEVGDAAEYLLDQTGSYDMTAALELAERLGCVPLQLVLAAKKIKKDNSTIGAYAARLVEFVR